MIEPDEWVRAYLVNRGSDAEVLEDLYDVAECGPVVVGFEGGEELGLGAVSSIGENSPEVPVDFGHDFAAGIFGRQFFVGAFRPEFEEIAEAL